MAKKTKKQKNKCHDGHDDDFVKHIQLKSNACTIQTRSFTSVVIIAFMIIMLEKSVNAMEDDFEKLLRGSFESSNNRKSNMAKDIIWENELKNIYRAHDFGSSMMKYNRDKLSHGDFEPNNADEGDMGSSLPSWIVSQYGQDRSDKLLGTGPEYVMVNTYNDRLTKRQKEMEALDEIKNGLCGGFEEQTRSLSSLTSESSLSLSWQPVQKIDYEDGPYAIDRDLNKNNDYEYPQKKLSDFLYCGSNVIYRDYKKTDCRIVTPKRHFCRAPHPERNDVTVSIERVGPFVSTGGYDWTSAMSHEGQKNVANLTNFLLENPSASIIGGMFSPVHANGTIIGFPPLHIHHAHIYPYGSKKERREKIPGSERDDHDILFQSHGETACAADQGDTACLLNLLDEGEGYEIKGSQTGLSSDWEVNDVRPKGSEPFKWYVDIVVMHKPKKESKVATFMGAVNPCVGMGPCTYSMPQDVNSNLMFYEYNHTLLNHGVMKNWVLHSHMRISDSMFLFKGHGARAVMEDFFTKLEKNGGKKTGMPIILDCHGYTLESAKKEILDSVMKRDDAKLVCEMTKPSLHFECDPTNTQCTGYDRRAHLNCLKELEMDKGDVLAMIAFNQVRPHNMTRTKNIKDNDNSADETVFAVNQHSVFRADFISEEESAPPAIWLYADEEFVEEGGYGFATKKGYGFAMDAVHMLEEKLESCPSSKDISYAWNKDTFK